MRINIILNTILFSIITIVWILEPISLQRNSIANYSSYFSFASAQAKTIQECDKENENNPDEKKRCMEDICKDYASKDYKSKDECLAKESSIAGAKDWDKLSKSWAIVNTLASFITWTLLDLFVIGFNKGVGCNTPSKIIVIFGVIAGALGGIATFIVDFIVTVKIYKNYFFKERDGLKEEINQKGALEATLEKENAKLTSLKANTTVSGVVTSLFTMGAIVAGIEHSSKITICLPPSPPDPPTIAVTSVKKTADVVVPLFSRASKLALARVITRTLAVGYGLENNICGLVLAKSDDADTKQAADTCSQVSKMVGAISLSLFAVVAILSTIDAFKRGIGNAWIGRFRGALWGHNTSLGRIIIFTLLSTISGVQFAILLKQVKLQTDRVMLIKQIIATFATDGTSSSSSSSSSSSGGADKYVFSNLWSRFTRILWGEGGFVTDAKAVFNKPSTLTKDQDMRKLLFQCIDKNNKDAIDSTCECRKGGSCWQFDINSLPSVFHINGLKNTIKRVNGIFRGELTILDLNLDEIKKDVDDVNRFESVVLNKFKEKNKNLVDDYQKAKATNQLLIDNMIKELSLPANYSKLTEVLNGGTSLGSFDLDQYQKDIKSTSINNSTISNGTTNNNGDLLPSTVDSQKADTSSLSEEKQAEAINDTDVKYKIKSIENNSSKNLFEIISFRYQMINIKGHLKKQE